MIIVDFLKELKKLEAFNKAVADYDDAAKRAQMNGKDLADTMYTIAGPLAHMLTFLSAEERDRFTKSLRYVAEHIDKIAAVTQEIDKTAAKNDSLKQEASAYTNAYAKKFFEETGTKLNAVQWNAVYERKLRSLRNPIQQGDSTTAEKQNLNTVSPKTDRIQ